MPISTIAAIAIASHAAYRLAGAARAGAGAIIGGSLMTVPIIPMSQSRPAKAAATGRNLAG